MREHTPARGPGWRPAAGARVVVDDAALADEGEKPLADELKLSYAGQTGAKDGDVELGLNSGGADPELQTLTVKNRRVTISAPGEAGVFDRTRTLNRRCTGAVRRPRASCATSPPSHAAGSCSTSRASPTPRPG